MSVEWDERTQDHDTPGTFGAELAKFMEDWAEQRLIGVLTNERLGYLKLINDQNHQIQTLYENIILGGGALHNPSLRLMESADGMTMLDDDHLLLIHGARLSELDIDNTISTEQALDRSLTGITLIGNTIWGVDANHDIYSVPRLGTMTTQYWQSGDTVNNVYGLAHAGNKLYWLENNITSRHLHDLRSREISTTISCMSSSSLTAYPSDQIYINANNEVRSIYEGDTTSLRFQLPSGTFVAVYGHGSYLYALKNTGEMHVYSVTASGITRETAREFETHNPPLTSDPITHAAIAVGRVNQNPSFETWAAEGIHVLTIRAVGETVTTVAKIEDTPEHISVEHTNRLNQNRTIESLTLTLNDDGSGAVFFIENGGLWGRRYILLINTTAPGEPDPEYPPQFFPTTARLDVSLNYHYQGIGTLPFDLGSSFVMGAATINNNSLFSIRIVNESTMYDVFLSLSEPENYVSGSRPPEFFPLLNAKITHASGTALYAVVDNTLYRLSPSTGNVEYEFTKKLDNDATDICTYDGSLLYLHSGGISELVISSNGATFAEHTVANAPANVVAIEPTASNFIGMVIGTSFWNYSISRDGNTSRLSFGADTGSLALDSANTDPISLARHGNTLYVLDGTAKKLFDYNLNATAQNNFVLNTNPVPLIGAQTVSSITQRNDFLYVTYRPPNVDITILATYDLVNTLPSYTLHTLDTTQPISDGVNPTTNDANLPHLEAPATVAVQGETMYVLLDSKLYTVSLNSVSYGDVLGVLNLNTESATASRIAIWRDAIWHYTTRLQIEVLRQLHTRSTTSNSKIDQINTKADTISGVTSKIQFGSRNEVKADIESVKDTLVPMEGIDAFKATIPDPINANIKQVNDTNVTIDAFKATVPNPIPANITQIGGTAYNDATPNLLPTNIKQVNDTTVTDVDDFKEDATSLLSAEIYHDSEIERSIVVGDVLERLSRPNNATWLFPRSLARDIFSHVIFPADSEEGVNRGGNAADILEVIKSTYEQLGYTYKVDETSDPRKFQIWNGSTKIFEWSIPTTDENTRTRLPVTKTGA